MSSGKSQPSFAEEFERVLIETDTSIRRLSRLSDIPRRTLENWLYGRSQRPRHVEPILTVARALHLPAHDADRLLMSAGHPSLAELQRQKKSLPPELLEDWQLAPDRLMGQKSASLSEQHNLPAATTSFLGRNGIREDLASLIRRPDLRLVTVTGLGGAGKTRLALETARSLVGFFDHGVYFVALDNVDDADGFWQAILEGLDIPSDGVNSAQQLVENYLQNKQILLLLDNFEHLLPLTAEISNLLSQTQRLNLLITSRQALDLQAEQLCSIGGLSCERGQESAAYQLFIETARRRTPGYRPSHPEVGDIIALCSQVEGLPLAIELAATWTDILKPAQILTRLRSDLHEVWHSAADRPQRQQSLWSLFDYSWQMLPMEEQEAAMRLAVLRGTFTPETAMAVAGCRPAVIKRLINASFLKRTSGNRLMLHRLVRQFLSQQAVRRGYAIQELEDRYMEIILAWAADQSSKLRQTFKVGCLQNLHREWQHIDHAWWLAVDRERYELLESCRDIIVYFEARGTWGQGAAFFAATRRRLPSAVPRMQAFLDEAESVFAARLFEIPRSVKLSKRALQTLEESGVDSKKSDAGSYARAVLFTADYVLNQRATSEEIQREFRAVTGEHLAKAAEVISAHSEGVRLFAEGEVNAASALFSDVLELIGSEAFMVPTFQCFLGISLRGEGLDADAREQFELALQRALEIDVYPAVVTATYELRLLAGDNPSTQQCRQALEDLALQMGSRGTVGRVAAINAIQYLNLGLFKRGTQLMRIGVGMLWNEVDSAERRRILSTIAQAYIAFGLAKTAPQVLALVAPKGTTAN
ncbi:MAG: ATP-binding protein [Candidatus Promineifilaceae bacterium]